MCICCVRNRVVGLKLALPIFHGSGEVYSLLYVEIGLMEEC